MTIPEIPFRVGQLVKKEIEKRFLNYLIPKQVLKPITSKILVIEGNKQHFFEPYIWVFGEKFDYDRDPIHWHRDIFSGKEFPLSFAKSISIRKDSELSAKNVWEINRLEFLAHIAINYKTTGEERYLQQFIRIIESWYKENPYLMGVNWYSNIEINIRLINWFLCWEILNVEELEKKNTGFGSFLQDTWLPLIYQHCRYSYANPSKFSSANNHLISEYAGLFIAASKWEFKESKEWLKYAKQGLEKEIEKQHSNGINKEEAAEYIQFITDFFLIAYVVAENTNNCFSAKYKQCIHEIFEYVYEFTDIKTNFPKYGDEDDGKVVCFSSDVHFNNFKSLLTSAAIIFQDERYKSKSAGFDLKNEILFGEIGKNVYDKLDNIDFDQDSKFYKQEGHFIFRKQENKKEIYLHMDAAPLGYLSIAAHGHADALSVILHVNGIPVLVDSGTYSYHVAKEWRNYFVSTMAHNTICLDNKNQANQAGDTMWLDHYKCPVIDLSTNENSERVVASHDGYKPLIHTRSVEFNRIDNRFEIIDTLISNDSSEHEAALLFHLHPEIVCTLNKTTCDLKHKSGIGVKLELQETESMLIEEGDTDPILGWYSESFMQKCPTKVVYQKIKFTNSIQLKSKIKIYEY